MLQNNAGVIKFSANFEMAIRPNSQQYHITMKTKFLILPLAGLLLSAGSVYAQRIITPFTPRIVDSLGRKVYVQPQQKQRSKIAITFQYGYWGATMNNDYANKRFPFIFNNMGGLRSYDPGDIRSSMGSIAIGFNYEINPWLELNIPFVYTHSTGYQRYVVHTELKDIDLSGDLKDDWVSILPTLRVNWVRNNWLSVYTRAGIGVGIGNRWVSIDADQSTKCVFAWQVSPVGVEMGKGNLCFFIEGGYGYTGALTGGLKLKIGKMTKEGKVSTGRQVEWYEKYMH